MSERKKRDAPARTPSTYIRGDLEINRLRSGYGVLCEYCGANVDERCIDQRDTTRLMLYNHPERRKTGKLAADALVIARGKAKT